MKNSKSENKSGTLTANFDVYPSQVEDLESGQVAIGVAVIRKTSDGKYTGVLEGVRTIPDESVERVIDQITDTLDAADDDTGD